MIRKMNGEFFFEGNDPVSEPSPTIFSSFFFSNLRNLTPLEKHARILRAAKKRFGDFEYDAEVGFIDKVMSFGVSNGSVNYSMPQGKSRNFSLS